MFHRKTVISICKRKSILEIKSLKLKWHTTLIKITNSIAWDITIIIICLLYADSSNRVHLWALKFINPKLKSKITKTTLVWLPVRKQNLIFHISCRNSFNYQNFNVDHNKEHTLEDPALRGVLWAFFSFSSSSKAASAAAVARAEFKCFTRNQHKTISKCILHFFKFEFQQVMFTGARSSYFIFFDKGY